MAQLICQDLCVGYDGKAVLQDLSFAVFSGDYLCIVGENGSGKSTLMKTILGLQQPVRGRILTLDGLRKNEIGLSAAANAGAKRLPGIRERDRSFRVSGTLRQPPLLQQRRKAACGGCYGKDADRAACQSDATGSFPAGSSSGCCLPVRCAPHGKCCFWTSLSPGLIPRPRRRCMRLSKSSTGRTASP